MTTPGSVRAVDGCPGTRTVAERDAAATTMITDTDRTYNKRDSLATIAFERRIPIMIFGLSSATERSEE
jgi:hypothetical protein